MGKMTWMKIGGTWTQAISIWQKINGKWIKDVMPKVNDGEGEGGVWYECMPTISASTSINIQNNLVGSEIIEVKVNGVTVSGGTYPISFDDAEVSTTYEIGVYDIYLILNGEESTNSVTVIDSDSHTICVHTDSGGNVTINNCSIASYSSISISLNAGTCL